MSLEFKEATIKGKANSIVGDFAMEYTYDVVNGEVTLVRARGQNTKEGSKEVLDITLYPTNGNLQSTVHYSTKETNLSAISTVVSQMYEIIDSQKAKKA